MMLQISVHQKNLANQRKYLNYLEDKSIETKHLRQKNRELINKYNDLYNDTQGLEQSNGISNNKDLMDNAIKVSKELNKITLQNEGSKEQMKLNKDLYEQQKENKLLQAKVEALKNWSQNPIIQQQTKELVKQEIELKMNQEIGDQFNLTIKKTKQNQEAAFANEYANWNAQKCSIMRSGVDSIESLVKIKGYIN